MLYAYAVSRTCTTQAPQQIAMSVLSWLNKAINWPWQNNFIQFIYACASIIQLYNY